MLVQIAVSLLEGKEEEEKEEEVPGGWNLFGKGERRGKVPLEMMWNVDRLNSSEPFIC